MSLLGVNMGFQVTQLSGVYHVFLRTRLFLSFHFRSHMSPGRSQCLWRCMDWGEAGLTIVKHILFIECRVFLWGGGQMSGKISKVSFIIL
jgi:hypothetical protein